MQATAEQHSPTPGSDASSRKYRRLKLDLVILGIGLVLAYGLATAFDAMELLA